MLAGQLLRGSNRSLGLPLVIAGEEQKRPAGNASARVGLLDGQGDALVDRGALRGELAGAGVDLTDDDPFGGGDGSRYQEKRK